MLDGGSFHTVPADGAEGEGAGAPHAARHADPSDSGLERMPSPTHTYTDSTLFLEVDKTVMQFDVNGVEQRDGVWYYHIRLHTALQIYTEMATAEEKAAAPEAAMASLTRQYRYSKLDWLKQALTEEYPAVIIPPTPPKDASSAADKIMAVVSEKGNEDGPPPLLVRERQRELEYFLNYLASHPALREGAILRDFLKCSSEQDFNALREKVVQQHAEAARHRLKPDDARRNAAYKTKNAFSWLKSKVTNTPTEPAEEDPLTAPLAAYVQQMAVLIDNIRAQTEAVYLEAEQRAAERLPHLPPAKVDWAARALPESELVEGTSVSNKLGQVGKVVWTGKVAAMPNPTETHAGVQWLVKEQGSTDGTAFGTRYFQGTNGPKGCSFLPLSHLFRPLERDAVVCALEVVSHTVEAALRELPVEQEKRLFHLLSDLQILKGWLESSRRCVAHFNTANLTIHSIEASLKTLKQGKKEDLTLEMELEERVEKYKRQTELEKKTFEAEIHRMKRSVSLLWRGILQNFYTFQANVEVHQGLDTDILAVTDDIEALW